MLSRTSISPLLCSSSFRSAVLTCVRFRHTRHDDEEILERKSRRFRMKPESHKMMKSNRIVYPPQAPGEPRRPAEVCHIMLNCRYSHKKLWYITKVIQGRSIDEALKRVTFMESKGAAIAKQVLEEAQDMAVNQFNVEYKSNLWVEKAASLKGPNTKSVIKACRMPVYVKTQYSHLFVRLREGKPPDQYYARDATGHEKLEDYIKGQRQRTIRWSL